MKTNFHLRSNKKRAGLAYIKRASLAVGIFGLLALLLYFTRPALTSIVAPVWRGNNVASKSLASAINFIDSKSSLIEENQRLKDELASYKLKRAHWEGVEARQDELLALAGRARERGGTAAGVLAHPPQSPYDILVIDAGQDSGIRLGARVSLPEGPLLGEVSEVSGSTAKVELFSKAGEEINAVLERFGQRIVLRGAGGGMFETSLPRDMAVEVGDRVLSPGVDAELLGVVSDISMKPTDSYKKVLVKGPANIFSLRFVLVR